MLKSSSTGKKAHVGLHRDRGFSRWLQVLLQAQSAVFAGGKPELVAALMIPTHPVGKSELPGTPSVVCIAQTQVLLKINSAMGLFFSFFNPVSTFPSSLLNDITTSRFLHFSSKSVGQCWVPSCQMNTTNQTTLTLH